MAAKNPDSKVSIEISIAEHMFVSIETSSGDYDRVLKDAREIAKGLYEDLRKLHKESESSSNKLYG